MHACIRIVLQLARRIGANLCAHHTNDSVGLARVAPKKTCPPAMRGVRRQHAGMPAAVRNQIVNRLGLGPRWVVAARYCGRVCVQINVSHHLAATSDQTGGTTEMRRGWVDWGGRPISQHSDMLTCTRACCHCRPEDPLARTLYRLRSDDASAAIVQHE